MDIVIPYKNSPSNGLELRYTLRGIHMYFHDLENIFIIGDFPGFLQNVIHIPFTESPERHHKQRNICSKLLEACQDKRVSDSFAWFSDDHFLLKPYQVEFNYRATLEESIKAFTVHQNYRNTLINTYHKLGGSGYDYGHGPMVFEKERFVRAVAGLRWNIAWGYAIKSIYCGHNGITGERYPDLKIKIPCTISFIKSLIADRPYFSMDDRGLNDDMLTVLELLYPNKSLFENEGSFHHSICT
jgi:hypothetical protein